jgi:cysteine-rich repeat protein
MTTQRITRTITALTALATLVAACTASPLPYPPDIQTGQLALTDDAHGGITLSGSPGAVSPAGMALRVRNASRPATPFDFTVRPDGSFTATVDGYLADVLRLDRNDADPHVLLHLASAGTPAVRRVPAPTDVDGDGWAVGLDCNDGNPHVFPGAPELCDGLDNDCDGVFDETTVCAGLPCTADADCADARFCDGDEICLAGRCAAGDVPVCDDGDPGTTDLCDPSFDACVHLPAAEPLCGNGIVEAGEACDDGNTDDGDGCPGDCRTACVPAVEICNGIDDDCDGAIDDGLSCGLLCTTDPDCDDGLFCTTESCTAGACASGPPRDCDDGDPATADSCDETARRCDNRTCDPAWTMCGGVCVDLLFSDLNCGACGAACPAGQLCQRGICGP